MPKWIHNIQAETKVYQGREILAGAFFQIEGSLDSEYRSDALLISDLALSVVRMSADGLTDYSTNGSSNVDFLKNMVREVQVTSQIPFGAKSQVIDGVLKKFYARNTGKQFDVVEGSNELTYTATFPWVKMLGIECINAEALDTAELRVYDSPAGTYSGVPNALLNQFGYTLNMAAGFYGRSSPFDADLYAGMVIKITYVSQSLKKVGVNFLMNEVKS